MNHKFIVYTPDFDIKIGGIIVLHFLCHLINSQTKFRAFLWNINLKENKDILNSKTYSKFITPWILSKDIDLNEDIIIYPEVIDGNPLNAKNVIRWLLHFPGFFTKRINFGENDLIFGISEQFSTLKYPIDKKNLLTIFYFLHDTYFQYNFAKREGSCHLIKKGKGKNFVHDSNSICIDNLSHEEIAKLFNEKETFISYDAQSVYSTYAVLCGCISIVVPDKDISKDIWASNKDLVFGIFYGLNDEPNLKYNNKNKILEHLNRIEKNNIKSVKKFIKSSNIYFKEKTKNDRKFN